MEPIMSEPKLLTDDELRMLASASEDSLSARQLLSHIAAQAAEIERLGAVPETVTWPTVWTKYAAFGVQLKSEDEAKELEPSND